MTRSPCIWAVTLTDDTVTLRCSLGGEARARSWLRTGPHAPACDELRGDVQLFGERLRVEVPEAVVGAVLTATMIVYRG